MSGVLGALPPAADGGVPRRIFARMKGLDHGLD